MNVNKPRNKAGLEIVDQFWRNGQYFHQVTPYNLKLPLDERTES